MCCIGDIIIINRYIGDDGTTLKKHSFVVIDDNSNTIQGLHYDLVANVMSSFKNSEHRKRKLKHKENIEITSDDIISNIKNNKSGYIKADQLYYFDKNKIDYFVFAQVTSELLDELIRIILKLERENRLRKNLNNLIQTDNLSLCS